MAIDRKIALKIEANTRKAEADIKRLQSRLNNLSKVKLGAVATNKMTTGKVGEIKVLPDNEGEFAEI